MTDSEQIQSPETPQPAEKPNRPTIKQYWLPIGAAVILAGGGFFLGYFVGHKQGLTVVGFDADAQELAEVVQKQKKSLDTLGVALNTATQERDVAVDNAKQLTVEVNTLRQTEQLTEALNHTYIQHIKTQGGLPLAIQNISVQPLPSNAYEYVLDLVQVSPSDSLASGKAEIRLIQGDEILAVPMEVSDFSFKNYQRMSGRWTMPAGFKPQFLEVRLNAGANSVAQRYTWKIGKPLPQTEKNIGEIPQTQGMAE